MEILDISRPVSERERAVPPEQLPLLWEDAEAPSPARPAPRAASERDAAIERETRRAKTVLLTLLGAILLASHFL
ncbi:hypothetical protein SOM61_01815 [Massilia sp. CFBP9012]|uniref:hypothetical protein n=1 Tax=Massilia sp. CFBP9012 TaxID=3096531 RepID=UPI002A69C525|nr:hypothetical protein [Massilia sp. CFBP9012]MDY0973683.1 hypothetical protein [Massilia sp. CFBP9012]